MELVPYIFFYGRCERALEFYKAALGGSYELSRVKDSPMAAQMPPEAQNSVMHATFTAPGMSFMASDGREVKEIDPDEGNVSLSLSTSDPAEADRVFAALAAGGTVEMPLGPVPWGGRFGMIDDRFGLQWMITSP